MSRRALLVGVAVTSVAAAWAGGPGLGAQPAAAPRGPAVSGAWSRPAPQGRTGVLYLTITGGAEDDRLVRVDAAVAARAELHRSFDDRGVMRMRPVDAIEAPAGVPVHLAPGGYHVMLVDLARGLRAGDTFDVTLTFEKAGRVDAVAAVRGAGGPAAAMDGMTMPDRPSER